MVIENMFYLFTELIGPLDHVLLPLRCGHPLPLVVPAVAAGQGAPPELPAPRISRLRPVRCWLGSVAVFLKWTLRV